MTTVKAQISGDPGEPLVWTRSFAWGSLLVHDPDAEFVVPEGLGSGAAAASSTVLAVPVLPQQDRDTLTGWPEDLFLPWAHVDVYVSFRPTPPDDVVQFECMLDCPSGHLLIGDADGERDVSVAPGRVRVQVGLVPYYHADVVVLRLLGAEAD